MSKRYILKGLIVISLLASMTGCGGNAKKVSKPDKTLINSINEAEVINKENINYTDYRNKDYKELPSIELGTYNGISIEWLKISENVLLSKYVIDSKRIDEKPKKFYPDEFDKLFDDSNNAGFGLSSSAYTGVSRGCEFKNSELYYWLNNDFYNIAFNDNEKALIKEVIVPHKDTIEFNYAVIPGYRKNGQELEGGIEYWLYENEPAKSFFDNSELNGREYTSKEKFWMRKFNDLYDKYNKSYYFYTEGRFGDSKPCDTECGVRVMLVLDEQYIK